MYSLQIMKNNSHLTENIRFLKSLYCRKNTLEYSFTIKTSGEKSSRLHLSIQSFNYLFDIQYHWWVFEHHHYRFPEGCVVELLYIPLRNENINALKLCQSLTFKVNCQCQKTSKSFSIFFSLKNTNLGAHFLLLTFFDKINF